MFDFNRLEKYDTSRLYKVYDIWPQIAKNSYSVELPQADFKDITDVVFAGMGGSGAIHDVFSAILSKTNVHVNVVKGYHLPKTASSNTLVIATSVSGNTIETIRVLDSAKEQDYKAIAFSDGGKMEDYCLKNRIEHRHIPMYNSPRASFTSFLFSMLKILQPIIPINDYDVFGSINNLEQMQKKISSHNLTLENPSLSLAVWLKHIPVIYYPWGLQAAAVRFKNSLQENAKTHGMIEDIIEACHNGIVAWEKSSSLQPILIRGEDDYIKTKERWEIIKEYFKINNIEYREICSIRGNILSKIINLIYLLDYSTIYRAAILGIDPTPVKSIDFIKNRTRGE